MSIVYDTDIYIGYKIGYETSRAKRGVLLCSVVVHELIAGAAAEAAKRALLVVQQDAAKQEIVITPNAEDWVEAGKMLYALRHGLKSRAKGKTPSIPAAEVQRITRAGITVIHLTQWSGSRRLMCGKAQPFRPM